MWTFSYRGIVKRSLEAGILEVPTIPYRKILIRIAAGGIFFENRTSEFPEVVGSLESVGGIGGGEMNSLSQRR